MKKVYFFGFIFFSYSIFAQETIQNNEALFQYIGQYKISKKWGYHLDALFRLDNQLQQNLQNAFRIGGIYYLNSTTQISGGYALVNVFVPTINSFTKENRLWEQYQNTISWHNDNNIVTNRLRLEQRWVEQKSLFSGNILTHGMYYENRLRYLNRNLFHLFDINKETEELYFIVQNELFIVIGTNSIQTKFIDQNRFFTGFGLHYNHSIRLELGYQNQYVTSSTQNYTMNHLLSITLIQNLDLEKH